jgi:DNA polymerase III subunit delta'
MTEAARLDMDAPLPWLVDHWSRLSSARQSGRLSHALLVSGPPGVGKRHLAELLAHSLLCHDHRPNEVACGRCADCRLLKGDNHPDLVRVGPDPEAKSEEIPIAAVRALVERGALTPGRGAWKVTLIDPADHLNAAAANALLKTLEEPSGNALICLITEHAGRLPATVRSRCQQVCVPIPTLEQSVSWLAGKLPDADIGLRLRLAHGAPLRALSELDEHLLLQRRDRLAGFLAIARGDRDPVTEAAAWNGLGPRLCLDWLATWLVDLVRLNVAEDPAWLDNPDQRDAFRALARRIDPTAAHRLLQRVLHARGSAESRINTQLMFESLSIEWARVTAIHGARRI